MSKVVVWRSFSSNNSSDYRLVAEFDTPKRAKALAKELATFFEAHAEEYDEAADAEDFDWPGEPTSQCHALGKKYRHKWQEFLIWGDECLQGDEPQVTVVGSALVLYHDYCSGGFGPDIPAILEKAGGKVPKDGSESGPPVLLCELELPAASGGLGDELRSFLDQRLSIEHLCDWDWPDWADAREQGQARDVTYCVEGKRCTFTLPLAAANIAPFESYLKKGKAKKISLRLATDKDIEANREKEAAIAQAASEAAAAAAQEGSFDPTGCSFLFTGKLAAMTRADGQARTAELGGKVAKSVTKDLDVLVIGDHGSPLYGEGVKGSKQTKAEALIEAGAKIRIISETAFLQLEAGGAGSAVEAEDVVYDVPTKGKIEVNLFTEATSRVDGADEIVILPNGEFVAFAGDRGRTQRIVIKNCDKRTASNITTPRVWLQGLWIDDDGSWLIGGEGGKLYVSTDSGKFWQERPSKGLAKVKKRIWSVVRFGGDLWIAGEDCLAREHKGTFKPVPLPAASKDNKVHRLVVIGETLYALGKGIWRSKGDKLVTELKSKAELYSLLLTDKGTLLAVGNKELKGYTVVRSRTVWRKPHGGKWALLDDEAIGSELTKADIERKVSYSESFRAVVNAGNFILLLGEWDSPPQMNRIRISTDDGLTFKPLPVPKHPSFGPSHAAVADGRGGVIVGACGGVFYRVSRDGITPWEKKKKKKAPAKKAAKKKAATKKAAANRAAANKAAPTKATKKKTVTKKPAGGATVGKSFLFTGALASMKRADAKAKVAALGGVAASSVKKDLDYLVIGDHGSPLFGEGKKGSKMIAAEKLIESGAPLQIISETDFLKLKKK